MFMKNTQKIMIMLVILVIIAVVNTFTVFAECSPSCTYKDMVVGFIQTGSEGGWRAANTASFKETAQQLDIKLNFYDAQNRLENQVSAFRNFIADPAVNVIILAALETTGWTTC